MTHSWNTSTDWMDMKLAWLNQSSEQKMSWVKNILVFDLKKWRYKPMYIKLQGYNWTMTVKVHFRQKYPNIQSIKCYYKCCSQWEEAENDIVDKTDNAICSLNQFTFGFWVNFEWIWQLWPYNTCTIHAKCFEYATAPIWASDWLIFNSSGSQGPLVS